MYRCSYSFDTVVLLTGFGFQLGVFIDSRHPQHPIDDQKPLGLRHMALHVDDIEDTV